MNYTIVLSLKLLQLLDLGLLDQYVRLGLTRPCGE
jgi:hypothetical protein